MAAAGGNVFCFEDGGEEGDEVPKSLKPSQGILRIDANLHPRRRSSAGSTDDQFPSHNSQHVIFSDIFFYTKVRFLQLIFCIDWNSLMEKCGEVSPLPSVDRLSVSFVDMEREGLNLVPSSAPESHPLVDSPTERNFGKSFQIKI